MGIFQLRNVKSSVLAICFLKIIINTYRAYCSKHFQRVYILINKYWNFLLIGVSESLIKMFFANIPDELFELQNEKATMWLQASQYYQLPQFLIIHEN